MLHIITRCTKLDLDGRADYRQPVDPENGIRANFGWKRKERVFRKKRDVRMNVCFIYEESSSIYTHKLHRHTIYFCFD